MSLFPETAPMSDKDRYALSLAVKNRSWAEYHGHEAALRAQHLQNLAQDDPLAPPSPAAQRLSPEMATKGQLELFALLDRHTYDFIDQLLRRLPRKRQQEHFRKLFVREYHAVKDDGSIAFACGNLQRKAAVEYLRELVDTRLGLVLGQYQVDFAWLSFSMSERHQLACAVANVREQQGRGALLDLFAAKRAELAEKPAALPFYLLNEEKIKALAEGLANQFNSLQAEYFTSLALHEHLSAELIDTVAVKVYRHCGEICAMSGLPLPYWASFQAGKRKMEAIEAALNKVSCAEYWFRVMRKMQRQMVEHIAIACGDVRKDFAPYVSDHAFADWRCQVRKNFDFLKQMVVENIADPSEQVDLLEMYLRSNSNPALRRKEMFTRLRGLEEWAEAHNQVALFLTLTAPSAFHAQHSRGGRNQKWNGASPKETQCYLNGVWAQFRALLAKRKIAQSGMRVAEPHHDATPHWHLLVYVHQKDVEEVSRLFSQKALELNGEEKGARQHRCKVEVCDPNKGTATGYIAKYISKNIDGFALDGEQSDEMESLSLKDNAKRARAWASTWGIRQFQFYGASSIGVWRELRRLVSKIDDDKLEAVRVCADKGDYQGYLELQGGAGAPRKAQLAKLHYAETGENRYGEKTKRVDGVVNTLRATLGFIKTRVKAWKIVRRSTDSNATEPAQQATNRARSAPWTCVSNCNSAKNAQYSEEAAKQLESQLNVMAGRCDARQVAHILSGKPLHIGRSEQSERYVYLRAGQLISENVPIPALRAFLGRFRA